MKLSLTIEEMSFNSCLLSHEIERRYKEPFEKLLNRKILGDYKPQILDFKFNEFYN